MIDCICAKGLFFSCARTQDKVVSHYQNRMGGQKDSFLKTVIITNVYVVLTLSRHYAKHFYILISFNMYNSYFEVVWWNLRYNKY